MVGDGRRAARRRICWSSANWATASAPVWTEYRVTNRGGKGVRTLQVVSKNGPIVAASVVRDGEEVMLISAEGIMIRMKVDDISRQGRTTQGVRLMRLDEADKVVAIAHVKARDDDDTAAGRQGSMFEADDAGL